MSKNRLEKESFKKTEKPISVVEKIDELLNDIAKHVAREGQKNIDELGGTEKALAFDESALDDEELRFILEHLKTRAVLYGANLSMASLTNGMTSVRGFEQLFNETNRLIRVFIRTNKKLNDAVKREFLASFNEDNENAERGNNNSDAPA